jgi:hypothetical protein
MGAFADFADVGHGEILNGDKFPAAAIRTAESERR